MKVVGAAGWALRRVPVNSVVRKSVVFSNAPFLVVRLCSVSLVVRFLIIIIIIFNTYIALFL